MKRLLSLALILPTAALAHSGHDHGSVGGGFAHPLGGADHVLAMVALGLADAVLEKFGGDSLAETRRNARAYLDSLPLR